MTKCPQCGYSEVPEQKGISNVMNHYIDMVTKEVKVLNNSALVLEIKEDLEKGVKATKLVLTSHLAKFQGGDNSSDIKPVETSSAPIKPVETSSKITPNTAPTGATEPEVKLPVANVDAFGNPMKPVQQP